MADSPYGSQLDQLLNHAYNAGIMLNPITITTATTLEPRRLASIRNTRKTFFIRFFLPSVQFPSFQFLWLRFALLRLPYVPPQE